METFLACLLNPIDKYPGLRPIGIGKVFTHIAGKVVVTHIQTDKITSAGSLQVFAG